MLTAFAKIRTRNGIGPLIEVVVIVLIVNVALILRNRFLIEQEGVIDK
jgi:ACR3 family arsenite efflux pump ArsB